jgi:ABC-2 type transport system permease protein
VVRIWTYHIAETAGKEGVAITERDWNQAGAAASIVDRGYQHYPGARLGLGHALWTMLWAAIRRAMGIRRSARSKIMPWLLFGVAYVPVIVIVAVQATVTGSRHAALPSSGQLYSGYYAGIALVLILFASLVAPDLLCAERRERVISLYFVAPITRLHYVGAKFAGLAILLLLMTVVPAILLFAGLAALDGDTPAYLAYHLGDSWRIVLGGALLSLYYGAVAMAVAALTDRRVYASGATVGLLLVSSVAAGVVSQGMHFAGHQRFALVDLLSLPIQTVSWMFGQHPSPDLNGWAYLTATTLVMVISLVLLVWQYLRIRD